MAWGDVAKEALAKALEVYEKLAKLAAVVEQIETRVVDFRDETRKRHADLETRLEARQALDESRLEARIERCEARMRDLESQMASTAAKTDAAMATALEVILRERISRPLPEPASKPPRLPKPDGR